MGEDTNMAKTNQRIKEVKLNTREKVTKANKIKQEVAQQEHI